MTTRTNGRLVALAAAALLLLAGTAPAAPQAGTYLEMQSESGGQSQIIKLSLAADHLRIDSDMGFSLINIGGDGGKMIMVQHDQQQYMEFTAEMMEAMAAMAGQMPPQMEQEAESMEPPTFTRTGNTKQVGAWNAYEVLVEHPEQDEDLVMWLSQDVDADFGMLVEQVMASVSGLLNSPMMQMGGGNDVSAIEELRLAAMGMPDGFPVQVISGAGGMQSTSTLRAIDQSASFGPETWEPPAGYTKMDMPFIR